VRGMRHDPRQVIACVGSRTYQFCSLSLAMLTFGIKSTSQAVRLIENGQNVPGTGITLDWAMDDAPRVKWYEDVTEDMMSDAHIRRMKRMKVPIIEDGDATYRVPEDAESTETAEKPPVACPTLLGHDSTRFRQTECATAVFKRL